MGGYFQSDFELTPVVANNYIPLIAIQNMQTKENNLLFYSKPSFINVLRRPNTLKNIKDGFELSMTARRIEINGRVFFIAKGVFFSEAGLPLMVCAMKKEAYNNPSVSNFSEYRADNFSYNNYVLFYSTSFYTDPGLTPLNRRLQKEILQACYEKGIEVRTITSLEIEKNTFARVFEVKKTKSLTQLEAYMQQVLPNFLHNEGEDTFIEKEFEPIVLAHEEELSVEDEALLFDNESTPVTEPIVPVAVIPNRQLTLDEVIEMAELEAEAATFNHPLEPEIDWATVEAALDTEESAHTGSERNLTIHTSAAGMAMFQQALRAEVEQDFRDVIVSERPIVINSSEVVERFENAIEEVRTFMAHPASSLVERMRPLQDAYNRQMLQAQQDLIITGEAIVHNDQLMASALASLAQGTTQVGQVTWRTARREGQIELIDDTE